MTFIIFVSVSVRAFFIIRDNRALRDVAEHFRQINSLYRDKLFALFHFTNPLTRREELIETEKSTVRAVCQKIAKIYSNIAAKDCLVTVKLLTQEGNDTYVTTYARSEDDSERDKADPKKFDVGHNQNTAFDMAARDDTTGSIPCFHSANLLKHKNYNNQRPNWQRFYKSAIVVPIRCPAGTQGRKREDLGFLCVDSKSKNRLNGDHHVVMLASLADQMYNFMSLMRGNYTVTVKTYDEDKKSDS